MFDHLPNRWVRSTLRWSTRRTSRTYTRHLGTERASSNFHAAGEYKPGWLAMPSWWAWIDEPIFWHSQFLIKPGFQKAVNHKSWTFFQLFVPFFPPVWWWKLVGSGNSSANFRTNRAPRTATSCPACGTTTGAAAEGPAVKLGNCALRSCLTVKRFNQNQMDSNATYWFDSTHIWILTIPKESRLFDFILHVCVIRMDDVYWRVHVPSCTNEHSLKTHIYINLHQFTSIYMDQA